MGKNKDLIEEEENEISSEKDKETRDLRSTLVIEDSDSRNGVDSVSQNKDGVNEKKKSKKGLIILAVLAIVIILAFAFRYSIMNLFMSPEQRMAFAFLNTAKEQIDKYDDLYEGYISVLNDADEMNATYNLDFTMGQGASQLLSQADVDASSFAWIKKASYQGTLASDESGQQSQGTLSINDETIASLAAIVDRTNSKFYLQVPTISEKYLGYDLASAKADNYVTIYEKYLDYAASAGENALSPDEIKALAEKYIDLYMVGWSSVEEKKGDLTAGGVTATYTTIDAAITNAEICKGKVAVLTEALQDEKLKQFIESMMAFAYSQGGYTVDDLASFDNIYADILEDWQQELDLATEELESYQETPDTIKRVYNITIYVTNSNIIKGICLENTADEKSIYLYAPEDGKNIGLTAGLSEGNSITELTGAGTCSKGKLSGSYTLSDEDTVLADMVLTDFDEKALEGGSLVGEVTLTPYNRQEDKALGDTTYDISFNLTEDQSVFDVTLSQSNLELCQIAFNAKRGQDNAVTFPEADEVIQISSADSKAFVNYCKTTDFTAVINALQAAGMSQELVTSIDTVTSYIEKGDLASLLLGLFFMQR